MSTRSFMKSTRPSLSAARSRRHARKLARLEFDKLVRDLSVYNTRADRMEIELLAGRSEDPRAEVVLAALNSGHSQGYAIHRI